MNSFLLHIIVLIIALDPQCVFILLLLTSRSMGKKKKNSQVEETVSCFHDLSLRGQEDHGSMFGQFRPLSKLPHKERQVHYFWLSVYKYASSRAQHKTNTLNSVVKQNDIRPCCQKECFPCFDVPELSPLFSCVVILGKKRNDIHGDGGLEGW